MAAPHAAQKLGNASLSRLDHEATFVETWHVQFQTTRQNRCLHGFGECRGALILHLVVVDTEVLQGGVRLVVLHSSDHTTQQTAERMLSLNAPPAWSKFQPQRMPCENAHNLECDDASCLLHQHMSSQPSANDAALNVC